MYFDLDVKLFCLLLMSMGFDWIFQSQAQAMRKFSEWKVRIAHAFTYATTTTVFLLLPFGYMTYEKGGKVFVDFYLPLVLFISHYLIDNRKAVMWIMKKKGIKEEEFKDLWWLNIALDQWLHMFINLYLATMIMEYRTW